MKRFVRIAVLLCAVSALCISSLRMGLCAQRTATVEKQRAKHSLHVVKDFDGIGNRDGTFDYGFKKTNHKEIASDVNSKKKEGIKLSPGMQKFADGAGKTLKNIDKAVFGVVKEPFRWLGLEAESAKIRPSHGGVGLGVSIKLHRDKKAQVGDSLHKNDDSHEFYDLIKPSDNSGTIR